MTLLGLCDRALADPDCPLARRARLLAQRASALAEIGDMESASADSAAAMTAAAAAGDPAAELDAIRARAAALSASQHRTELLRLGARTIELAAATGQPIAAVLGRVWRIDASYQLMNLAAVDAEIALIAQLAESTRPPLARWHLLRQQASRAALAGHFATARDRSEEARQLAVRIQDVSGTGMSYAFALALASIRGDVSELQPDFFEVLAEAPPIPVVRASHARALFAACCADEARAVYETLRQLPADGDRDVRTLGSLIQLIDLIIAYRDTDTAQATYDLFRPVADHGGTIGSGLVSLHGSVHWPLGRLAALLGRTEQALEHFASALAVNNRLSARPFVVVTRLDWAATLAARAAGDDLAQARGWPAGRRRGTRPDMPGPARRAEGLCRELEQAIGAANPLTRRAGDSRAHLRRPDQPRDRRPAGSFRTDRRGARAEHPGQAAADQPDRARGLGAPGRLWLTRREGVFFGMPRDHGPGMRLMAVVGGPDQEQDHADDDDRRHPVLARDAELHLATQTRIAVRHEDADQHHQDEPGHGRLLNLRLLANPLRDYDIRPGCARRSPAGSVLPRGRNGPGSPVAQHVAGAAVGVDERRAAQLAPQVAHVRLHHLGLAGVARPHTVTSSWVRLTTVPWWRIRQASSRNSVGDSSTGAPARCTVQRDSSSTTSPALSRPGRPGSAEWRATDRSAQKSPATGAARRTPLNGGAPGPAGRFGSPVRGGRAGRRAGRPSPPSLLLSGLNRTS